MRTGSQDLILDALPLVDELYDMLSWRSAGLQRYRSVLVSGFEWGGGQTMQVGLLLPSFLDAVPNPIQSIRVPPSRFQFVGIRRISFKTRD